MDTFRKLFGSLLTLVYHCFDRLVILGHLPLLTRPENIVFILPRYPSLRPHYQGTAAETHRRVQPLGRSLRRETQDPSGMGRKRCAQGRIRSALPLSPLPFAPPPHATRSRTPTIASSAPSGSATLTITFISVTKLGSAVAVCQFLPPLPDHLLPQRPSLHRTRTAPPQDRIPQGR